jgi:anti-anti-sigma regulatory factor
MTRTRFCDSSGPRALVAAHQRAEAGGGEVLLVIPSALVLRVFALTGADRAIPSFASLAEAVARARPVNQALAAAPASQSGNCSSRSAGLP